MVTFKRALTVAATMGVMSMAFITGASATPAPSTPSTPLPAPSCGSSFRSSYTGYQQDGDTQFGAQITYVDMARWVGNQSGHMDIHFYGGSSDGWNASPSGGTIYPVAPTAAAGKPWRAWVYSHQNNQNVLVCTADFTVYIQISDRQHGA